eukprot:Nitzschia sp. Nitz4//scaffold37_size175936//105580//108219//NITZ4_002052-RA/size175936-snap-gene-0.245-mRNA-1//1//CDS//3329549806//6336//frame0
MTAMAKKSPTQPSKGSLSRGSGAVLEVLLATGTVLVGSGLVYFARRHRKKALAPSQLPPASKSPLPNRELPNVGHDNLSGPPASLIRFKENQKLINSVLSFWFGQHDPENSQKKLWMIANSSSKLRDEVDQQIAETFGETMSELVSETHSRWEEWCTDAEQMYGSRGKIAAIVVLDQFSRHVLRYAKGTGMEGDFPPQSVLDQQALKTAKLFVDKHANEIRCGMIPLPMYIFAMMPYRHAGTIETVAFVQNCIEESAGMALQLEAMLGRFRKATNRRMALLQDEARRSGKSQSVESDDIIDVPTSSHQFADEDILETFPFDADMTPSVRHPIHNTIVNFLDRQGIRPLGDRSHVIISLSGGVDSMVIARVLANLRENCGFNLETVAVHIDYGNRPESAAEADYVRRYCERLGLTFKCRRIDEVTRGVTARDDYERISRELRYSSYKEAISEIRTRTGSGATIGVMLGHHKGDLRENVLSNAHKGCGPIDLSGMTSVSKNDGVVIYRPLLPLEKEFVFDYAHKFGVPYFKDTTPHWSTRGKLRNKLLPLLEEIYGEGSLRNLSNLALESDECRALVQSTIIGPFLQRVQRWTMGISFETTPWKNQSVVCWKFMLREALHSAKFGMFSDKSVISFLERVQSPKPRAGWLQCRRDYAVYLNHEGRVFVMYATSFPFQKQLMYNFEGQGKVGDIISLTNPKVAHINKGEVAIGPWVVKAEFAAETPDRTIVECLAQKALPTMEDLMTGKIEYYLVTPADAEDPDNVRPLVFGRFTKPARPVAWKNNEQNRNMLLKVEETLPLLGNDEVAHSRLEKLGKKVMEKGVGEREVGNVTTRLVKVTMKVVGSEG